MTDTVKTTEKPTTKPKVTKATNESLFEALAKAQAEFLVVKRTKKAAYGKYAPLEELINAVRPALNAHGLFLTQNVTSDEHKITVETKIYHSSGECISSGPLETPLVMGGGRVNISQQMGSARTYACRYSLASFLALADSDDDDAQCVKAPITSSLPVESQNDVIEQARAKASLGEVAFENYFKTLTVEARKVLVESGELVRLRDTARNVVNNQSQFTAVNPVV